MTDPNKSLDEDVARLKEEADRMERPDRAIPLPLDEDDDGVGPVTGAVP